MKHMRRREEAFPTRRSHAWPWCLFLYHWQNLLFAIGFLLVGFARVLCVLRAPLRIAHCAAFFLHFAVIHTTRAPTPPQQSESLLYHPLSGGI